ncbi:class I SAM-dependent methyltransferase [Teredinibacter haidensis]|uniref:class I SAM-dependent methyltransferase n=1 Tax=Teredinibacter haidensis TaxID=2731755 RepID=UPI000948F707|nr:class I SAM-dependent methyltransferase [Teredinibacter haidensis]
MNNASPRSPSSSPTAELVLPAGSAWFVDAYKNFCGGRTEKAKSQALKRQKNHSNDSSAAYLLALCAEKKGQLVVSIEHCQRAIKLSENVFLYRKYLADLFRFNHNFSKSEQLYLALKKEEPENRSVMWGLALVWAGMGKYFKSLLLYAEMQRLGYVDSRIQTNMVVMLSSIKDTEWNRSIESAIIVILHFKNISLRRLSGPISRYLSKNLAISSTFTADVCNTLERDELFNEALKHIVLMGASLENLVIQARKMSLLCAVNENSFSNSLAQFSANVAQQAYLKEYVLFEDEQEKAIVEQFAQLLEVQLKDRHWSPVNSEMVLLCLSMYGSLYELPCRERLLEHPLETWPESLQAIAKASLFDFSVEEAIAEGLQAIVSIENDVSSRVRQQYEENPYPRWISVNENPPLKPADYICAQMPGFEAPACFRKDDVAILVAGSGTGRQPIELAMMFPHAKVTAVDLSRRSLAYGKRKATELNITNIEFYQGDILNLGRLGRQFDFIACSGVLHHMADPAAGWAVLRDLLVEGGLLNIALYSAVARKEVRIQRETLSRLALEPTVSNIRMFRRAMMEREPNNSLYGFHDFWTMSECRDLLFHVQEHQFTWTGIKEFCEKLEMRFQGVQIQKNIWSQFVKMFPEEKAYTNPESWAAFEQTMPMAFAGMYNFWCSKVE